MTLTQPRTDVAAPHATRSRRPGWRNPRLLLGIVLVAGSVILGARLLATAPRAVSDAAGIARIAHRGGLRVQRTGEHELALIVECGG